MTNNIKNSIVDNVVFTNKYFSNNQCPLGQIQSNYLSLIDMTRDRLPIADNTRHSARSLMCCGKK